MKGVSSLNSGSRILLLAVFNGGSNANIIVSDTSALFQAEKEIQLEHELIFNITLSENAVDDESKAAVPEVIQSEQNCEYTQDSAICSLLDMDAPVERSEVQDAHDDETIQELKFGLSGKPSL
ncbi:hypothetical protein L915_01360 [Phytophthora nicotianae]|uniref:Uncharacterized protein n=1 Tax=Phytophthora nicotianae TaxID=4792 RepID=W2JTN8_PHYNI|nr:hypothetical protein L915_01360 [Phytophthora nicotianae]ETL49137.1 hypothetical protein L916_01334 [Phytophthora nicotianae]ETM55435.1 hypothetical protein L914_01347 [Phytophthora nicotianae]